MYWRDFFYFSKGERSGLIILLCLITIAGILLIMNNNSGIVESNTVVSQSTTGKNAENNDSQPLAQSDNSQPQNIAQNKNQNASNSQNSSNAQNLSSSEPKIESAANDPVNANMVAAEKNESVSERVQRLTSYSRPTYTRTEKFEEGTVVELNTADTTSLKKVPGIGSTFAKRIVGYRDLLGGYYSVTQLSEVYGIDEERYNALVQWFTADPSYISKININKLPQDSLSRHPYLSYNQARVIIQLRRQKGKLAGWDNLQLLNEFSEIDKVRLQHYLSYD